MKLQAVLALLLLSLITEASFAGPFCRGRKSSSSSVPYYRPTVVIDYESPRRRIDYDVPMARTSNDFGNFDGQIINDSSGVWKWDASSQIWRGPVTSTTYLNGVPIRSERYWRK